jgi:hypothetical protein
MAMEIEGDKDMNEALRGEVQGVRGAIVETAELRPMPARFTTRPHDVRAAVIIEDTVTTRTTCVPLFAYGSVREALTDLFGRTANVASAKDEGLDEYVEVDTSRRLFFVPATEFAVATDVETEEEYVEVNMQRLQKAFCEDGEEIEAFRLVLLTEDEYAREAVLSHDKCDARWARVSKHGVR